MFVVFKAALKKVKKLALKPIFLSYFAIFVIKFNFRTACLGCGGRPQFDFNSNLTGFYYLLFPSYFELQLLPQAGEGPQALKPGERSRFPSQGDP